MKRVMDKALPGAPHEVLLVLDATNGQNAIAAGEAVPRGGGRHRHRAHQARRHRQGRGDHRHLRRAEDPGRLGGRGREDRRPAPLRPARVRRGAVRAPVPDARLGTSSAGVPALVRRGAGRDAPRRRLGRARAARRLRRASPAPPPETPSARALPEGCQDDFAGHWVLASDPSWSYRATDDGGTVVLDVERRWADGGTPDRSQQRAGGAPADARRAGRRDTGAADGPVRSRAARRAFRWSSPAAPMAGCS